MNAQVDLLELRREIQSLKDAIEELPFEALITAIENGFRLHAVIALYGAKGAGLTGYSMADAIADVRTVYDELHDV